MDDKLLTPEEAGELLSLHVETVRRMARDGRIPALKVGTRRWRFDPAELREWMKQHREE
jgi:excisionase family DNA binding protein